MVFELLVVLKAIMMALEIINGDVIRSDSGCNGGRDGGSDISIDYGEGKRGKACSTGKCGEDDCVLCVLW